ncbi:MAG: hypothetical protein QXY76_02670 [Nitrososphaeria archaeon]
MDRIQYIKLRSDVREKLNNTLTSIPELKKYWAELDKHGQNITQSIRMLQLPPSTDSINKLLLESAQHLETLGSALNSLLIFAKQAKEFSNYTSYMEDVKKVNKDLYEIINFFARNYQDNVFDTKELATFLNIYSPKLKMSEKEKLNENISEIFEKIEDLCSYISSKQISLNRRTEKAIFKSIKKLNRICSNFKLYPKDYETWIEYSPPWIKLLHNILKGIEKKMENEKIIYKKIPKSK